MTVYGIHASHEQIHPKDLLDAVARALAEALRERPAPPDDDHWATFVRNHDELTLDQLSETERREVFDAFGPEERMQLYGRGLRRWLPPMLDGDERRVRMVYSLLFSTPGTPVLFYGEEIGMGEDLRAEGRMAVRTPMQWAPGRGGGFSAAAPDRFPAPMVTGAFGPEHVNVRAQLRDRDSLLPWTSLLARRYRECPEIAWGEYAVLDSGASEVLAHRCDAEGPDGGTLVALHNLADRLVEAVLAPAGLEEGTVLVDLLSDGGTRVPAGGEVRLRLDGCGCRWLRVERPSP